jgi:quinol monooxygenase YgiN
MQTAFITFKTKNQQAADQLRTALLQLKTLSEKEEGAIEYEVFQSEEDNWEYFVRESWFSQTAFERHLGQPHLQQFFNNSQEWLIESFTSISLKALS